MYNVSQNYLNKSKAAGRVYFIKVTIGASSIFGGADILSLKIVRGQTSKSFMLGNTICASLEATMANHVEVHVNDPIYVYVRFGEGEDETEWQDLGRFYVDSINLGTNSKSIIAYDSMLRFSRIYNSSLGYPNNLNNLLHEICSQSETSVSLGLNLINNASINSKPQGTDKQAFYTRRDVLGYIAGINGGSAYIDIDGTVNISIPTYTEASIYHTEVIEQYVQDTNYVIEDVVWNTSNRTLSINDNYAVNTVDIYCPLALSDSTQTLNTIKNMLTGLSFDTVKIKKQGSGIFQLGDIVKYHAPDGKTYKMLIMGIAYDFSNGFFSETLYSLAPSESQQRNQGNKLNQEAITSTTIQGAANNLVGNFGQPYIFKWNDPTKIVALDGNGEEMFSFRAIGYNSQFYLASGDNSIAFNNLSLEIKGKAYKIIFRSDGHFAVYDSRGSEYFVVDRSILRYIGSGGTFEINSSNSTITLNGRKVLFEE